MSNRFVVDLSSVKLPKEATQRIQDGIQRSVLEAIAGLKLQNDIHIRFPREWIGIILSTEINALKELDQRIGSHMNF